MMMKEPTIARRVDVQQAADDLRSRTLRGLHRPLDRLIYLASTRDYNTGLYHHEGLAARHTPAAACEALAESHREAFQELLGCSVKELVGQMEGYMHSTGIEADHFLTSWKRLEPYRIAVPLEIEPLAVEFLLCNLRTALAILEARLHPIPVEPAA
jgi:hypothetical protein